MGMKCDDRKRAKNRYPVGTCSTNQEIMADHGLFSDRRKPHKTHAVCRRYRRYNTTCDLRLSEGRCCAKKPQKHEFWRVWTRARRACRARSGDEKCIGKRALTRKRCYLVEHFTVLSYQHAV